MPLISYQLYSSRNFPDLHRQCAMLAELGIKAVEPYRGLLVEADTLAAALAANGLVAPTCHVGLQALRDDFDGTVAQLKTIGTGLALVPAVPPEERKQPRAGWERLGAELSAFAARMKAEGIAFGWHNHDFEFAVLPDGTYPLEHILGSDPDLAVELDIAWVVRGGQDPAVWIERYADRIQGFHVKDIAPAGECLDEDGWSDVGFGTLNFQALLPAMRATPATVWVLEHDNPSDDRRFATRSFQTVSKW